MYYNMVKSFLYYNYDSAYLQAVITLSVGKINLSIVSATPYIQIHFKLALLILTKHE